MTDALEGSRILVTGGAGLIGKATIIPLIRAGAEVTGFDLASTPAALGARSVVGDLRDREAVARAVSGMDAVVHLGGIAGPDLADDITVYEVNTIGTYIVLSAAAAAGVGKVVYASSINANGRPIGQLRPPEVFPYDEDLPAAIADSYSLSKQANEAAARMAHDRWGLRC
ncbi:MAG: NAD-dependent epimerase/dehydratase family protein, partial [Propionibacteriaceae bacterium]|nr:NAD-dependent epimerase/dehydratase family protein [Propionibacteriaceae bacterium]